MNYTIRRALSWLLAPALVVGVALWGGSATAVMEKPKLDENGLVAGCTYAPLYLIKGKRNVVKETADEKDFIVHVYIQVAETNTPGCTDNIRAAINWECNWHGSPANCGAKGASWIDNENGTDLGPVDYHFGTSGPDGRYSVYSAWTPRYSCHSYRALIGVSYVYMGGQEYRSGNPYASYDYPWCEV